ncbi:MAG TPA: discoidin domain-containing protein [Nitrososphaeraceae archaeon]
MIVSKLDLIFKHIRFLYSGNNMLSYRDLLSFITFSLLLSSVMFANYRSPIMPAYSATCSNLPISTVKANGQQSTNPASEAIDNNLGTRWSNLGLGSWIRLDLGSQKTVCSVDITWFSGNTRQNTFTIAVSNDGNSFSNVFSGKSSGTTTAAEKYDFTDTQARYVRIKVTANTQNDWVSITEIDVSGAASSSTPPPSDTTAPTIASTSPGAGANDIQINSVIKTTFSEPLSPSSLSTTTFSLKKSGASSNLAGAVSLSSDGKTASFDPSSNLATSTTYAATISTGVKDLAGNPLSQSKTWSFTTAAASPPPSPNCNNNAPISAVTANGAESTHPPSYAIDNKGSTRWSNKGLGSWIRLDLGSQKLVCSIDISWYNGNQRQNSFTIAVSNDGNSFSNVFSGKSSGTTTAAEKYDFTDAQARYVRITVTANTQSDWASIYEIDVFTTTSGGGSINHSPVANGQNVAVTQNTAKSITLTASDSDGDKLTYSITAKPSHGTLTGTAPSLTYSPASGYTGADSFTFKVNDGKVDSAIVSISITVSSSTSPPAAGTDKFGIKKLYPTKSGGEEWYMNMANPQGDSRFNPQNTITKNSDGSWKMKSSKVRMGVYTSSGYSSSKIPTIDHSKILAKGYMMAPNDWKNFEMTMYTKVNTAGSDDNFAPYGRGGRHTGGGYPEGCEGSAYKGDIFFSGKVRFAKEQWHVSYVFTDYKTGTSSIKGKWIGFKYVLYNFQLNGKTAVKMELYLDKNNDGNFVKVDEAVDKGGWGNTGGECNGAPDQIITWGGPIATFRWDTATDVDFKNLSVREIQPPQ